MADRCLRATLPSDPLRVRVIAALGRMRYDGLNLGVQPEARRFKATRDGSELRVRAAAREGCRYAAGSSKR